MCKTIKQKVRFKTSPKMVYECLANAKIHSRWAGTRAVIPKKIGGAFSTQSGSVTGVIVDLAPGKRIVQAWRRRDFPPGVFSMAAFTLNETAQGGTELTLIHRGVPKELIPDIEREWRDRYWNKLKQYFERSGVSPINV